MDLNHGICTGNGQIDNTTFMKAVRAGCADGFASILLLPLSIVQELAVVLGLKELSAQRIGLPMG